VVPLCPWAVSEKAHDEFLNIYGVTHVLEWNLGQGEAAIACIRHKVQFLGFHGAGAHKVGNVGGACAQH